MIGIVLLLAITVVGATTVVALGGDAIDGIQSSATTGAAEQSMTQFDSKASLVAHGDSDTQRVQLAGAAAASRTIDADAGWMNITVRNATTGAVDEQLGNVTLGAVVYRDGDAEVAYQGGGVWRRSDGASSMVSPPEFHYQGTTLTLPLVRVSGDERLDDEVLVRQSDTSTAVYPNASAGYANPLDKGTVVIEVGSAYYEAWGRFFEQRTSGDVTIDHDEETATIELVVPFDTEFDNAVASTAPGGIDANPGPPPSPYTVGVFQPSADDLIESRVNECETNASACEESPLPSTLVGPETYFVDGDYAGDLDVDTSGGNVSLVVDGEFAPDSVTVSGGGTFTAYVRDDVEISGGDSINDGGDAQDVRVVVHSDGDADLNGKYRFVGFLYAPGSDIDLNGGGGKNYVNVEGGIIGETIDVNGKPNEFEYDPTVAAIDLDVTASTAPRITFLHVSVTEVEVEED